MVKDMVMINEFTTLTLNSSSGLNSTEHVFTLMMNAISVTLQCTQFFQTNKIRLIVDEKQTQLTRQQQTRRSTQC